MITFFIIYKNRKGSLLRLPLFFPVFPSRGNNIYNYFLFQGNFSFTQLQSGAPISAPATKTVSV